MLVSDASCDRQKGGLPLVSAAPRLVSARLPGQFPHPPGALTVWASHSTGRLTSTHPAGGSLSHGRYPPPGKACAILLLPKISPSRLSSSISILRRISK